MTLEQIKCKHEKRSVKKHDTEFCWTCGHYAQIEFKKCKCCDRPVVKLRRHSRMLEIKEKIDEIIETHPDPEYRFYINGWVCWIKQSDLNEYRDLEAQDKHERYYHFIKSLVESDRLARVFH
jgi:hypothetical protein